MKFVWLYFLTWLAQPLPGDGPMPTRFKSAIYLDVLHGEEARGSRAASPLFVGSELLPPGFGLRSQKTDP